jgi:hypothetical protein
MSEVVIPNGGFLIMDGRFLFRRLRIDVPSFCIVWRASPLREKKIEVILDRKKGKSFFTLGNNYKNVFVNPQIEESDAVVQSKLMCNT